MEILKASIKQTGELIPKILLFGAIAYLVFLTVGNISNPILDEYGFRQAQTAITSYYFVQDGFKLAYETPVVGYPWSIPFEFPIFQALVALTVKLLPIQLTDAGRLLSLSFFLLSVYSLIKLIELLSFSKNTAYVAAAIFTSTPLYLFYSGSFLIEGAALFFTVAYLYFLILLGLSIKNWNIKNISYLGMLLTLGLLQKLTTVFPVLIISPLILLLMLGKENFVILLRKPIFYYALLIGFLFPVLICGFWVHFTDQIKSQNVIGSALTSVQLRGWNFGTLKQRISSGLWFDVIYSRNIMSSPFEWIGLLLIAFGIIFANKKIKIILIVCLFLSLAPFLIFTNLHIEHKYYQYANLVFYLVAIVIAIQTLNDYLPEHNRSIVFNILAILLMGSNYMHFYADYYQKKITQINYSNRELLRVSNYIKTHTSKDRPIIIYGLDWSSELPFSAERKALALPWGRWDMEALQNPQKFLGNFSPSAVVLCGNNIDTKIIDELYRAFNISSKSMVDSCNIFLVK